MSVLIKEMEMPKSCGACELCACYVLEDGTEENYRCPITMYPIHDFDERHYRCPIIPAADVREVVYCKDCVYWQKPQVKQNDGTYRDYEPDEYENGSLFGGVTCDVGINIGSFCAKYNTEHQNRIPQFMDENDFCSKGYKLKEGET